MKITNKNNYPDYIVKALTTDDYDLDVKDTSKISVNQLISSPYKRRLFIRYYDMIEIDVEDLIESKIGTSIHKAFEIKCEDHIVEQRFEVDIDGIIVSGKPDVYQISKKQLRDIKNIFVGSKQKESWENQLNVYKFLLKEKGHEVESMFIDGFYRDWRAAKNVSENYPDCKIKHFEIDLWGHEYTRGYIKERVALHKKAMQSDIMEIPICTDTERWKSDDVFRLIKKGGKRSLKNFNNKMEAEEFAEQKGLEEKDYDIVFEKGKYHACDYCNVKPFCKEFQT